jgi:Flp pilus assembly protein CpaB
VRRFRLFLARRPLVYWLLVGLLAAATAGLIVQRIGALDAARRSWGDMRTVLVVRRPLAAGHRLEPDDTKAERWPVALLPDDAVSTVALGTVVAVPVAPGEPLVRRRLGRGDAGPVAGRLPPGTRGVAIPLGDAVVPVQPGDRVDVVAASSTPGAPGEIVAVGAPVITASDTVVLAAVRLDEVGAVAGAMANGDVLLVIDADPPASSASPP